MRISILLFILSCGCGYRWQPDYPEGIRPRFTVPFVAGDESGCLTAEIARALSSSGSIDVVSSGGDYELQVSILNHGVENIGYREDPQKVDGKVRKNLLGCEGRKTLTLQAVVYRGTEAVYGPYQISSEAEYDYVDGDSIQDLTFVSPEGTVVTVLPFSLGQLESIEAAQEAATHPLYRRIAQKVVDAISSNW